jgi:hypothetical protein
MHDSRIVVKVEGEMLCKKYDLRITGCSRQPSLFMPEICENCLRKAEQSEGMVTYRPKKKPLVRRQLAMSNMVKSYGKRYETF